MPAYASIGPQLPGIGQPDGTQLPDDLRSYFLNFGDTGAGFWRFLQGPDSGNQLYGSPQRGQFNYQGQDPLARYTQSQFDRYQNQWKAKSADEPGLGFYNFLQRDVNPQQEYNMLTPAQQGFFSNVLTPRARIVLR